MRKRTFGTAQDGTLVQVSADGVAAEESCAWVDLENPSRDELVASLESLGFTNSAIGACLKAGSRTRVVAMGEEAFCALPALASDVGKERVALGMLCRPNLCVTIHDQRIEGLDRTVDAMTAGTGPNAIDLPTLVGGLLLGLSQRAVDVVDDMRARVLEMQDDMDRDPDSVELDEILEYTGRSRTIDAVIGERLVFMDRIRQLESPVLDLSADRSFEAAALDTQYVERAIERLEKRLASLRERFGIHQQDRTNQRLAVLTVLSAIFLPLTLLAGIYGMNFEVMPELAIPWAYPATLSVMLAIALGMLWYFRSRGWFS